MQEHELKGVSSEAELIALLEAELEKGFPEADPSGSNEESLEQPSAKRQRLSTAAAPAGAARSSTCPPHPGFMGGICIRCAALREDKPTLAGLGGSGSGSTGGPGSAGKSQNAASGGRERGVALKYIHRSRRIRRPAASCPWRYLWSRLPAQRPIQLAPAPKSVAPPMPVQGGGPCACSQLSRRDSTWDCAGHQCTLQSPCCARTPAGTGPERLQGNGVIIEGQNVHSSCSVGPLQELATRTSNSN